MKVLVYGWYHQSNVGDDLFADAFKHLFPECKFVFCDIISSEELIGIDAVFFGGGSFLLSRPNIDDKALSHLKSKKIFYLGVGVEAEVHPIHLELMKLAKMIVTRSPDQVERLKEINPNSKWIPDLVYSLQSKVAHSPKFKKSVLIMPNISTVPKNSDPYWAHAAWLHFKSEFTQFLDCLIDDGFKLSFFSMCQGIKINDNWAAAELLSPMKKSENKFLLSYQPVGIESVTGLISSYDMVVTQRFHGIVLSEMTRTPYISIYHHDKLKLCQPNEGAFMSYHNISKQSLLDSFNRTMKMKFCKTLPVESTIFETLSREVLTLI